MREKLRNGRGKRDAGMQVWLACFCSALGISGSRGHTRRGSPTYVPDAVEGSIAGLLLGCAAVTKPTLIDHTTHSRRQQ